MRKASLYEEAMQHAAADIKGDMEVGQLAAQPSMLAFNSNKVIHFTCIQDARQQKLLLLSFSIRRCLGLQSLQLAGKPIRHAREEEAEEEEEKKEHLLPLK